MSRLLINSGAGALSNNSKVWERQEYPERPIWDYVTVNGQNALLRAVYGALNNVSYLELLHIGGASGVRTRSYYRSSDEISNSGYYVAGNSSSQPSSNGFSPTSGYYGINGCGNTGCGNSYYSDESGEFGYTYYDDAYQVMGRAISVRPNPIKNQNYEFTQNSQYVRVSPMGATWGLHVSESPGYNAGLNLTTLPGFTAASGQQTTSYGMAGYNAVTGMYIAAFRTGTSGSSYRLHMWALKPDLIATDFLFYKLKELFTAAKYTYKDIVLNNVANGNNAAMYALNLFPTDNGQLWIQLTDTSNATSGTNNLRLYRIQEDLRVAGSNAVPLTLETFAAVATSGAHYNVNSGTYYRSRFMFSENNKWVASYTHHYYYVAGATGFILSNENTDKYYRFNYSDTTYGYSIAPSGESAFVFSRGVNKDGAANHLWFVDVDNADVAVGYTFTSQQSCTGVYPQIASSTMYQGQFVNKVLPLSLYR